MIHYPVVFNLGIFQIPAHPFFEFCAFITGFKYYQCARQTQKDFLSEQQRFYLLAGAALGAMIFSKLLGALSAMGIQNSDPVLWKLIFSGKSIVGALLGGILGVEIIKKILNISQSTGDLFTFPLILAIMIGRIGCFLVGVYDGTHGLPTHLPWAMDMGDGVLRHPAQLYEILFLGVLWILLKAFEPYFKQGYKFKIFMVSYLFYRLWSETIKPMPVLMFNLTAIQLACLGGLVYYHRIWIFFGESLKGRKE